MSSFRKYLNEIVSGTSDKDDYYPLPRTKGLEKEEAIKIIKSKCKNALKNKSFLYRGTKSKFIYSITDPTKGTPRASRNIANYVTLFMDNLPSWNKYPKRSRSVVCSTISPGAFGYGSGLMTRKIVIPFDGSKIGLCSSPDIWTSWKRITYLDTISDSLVDTLVGVDDTSWPDVKKALIKIANDLYDDEVKNSNHSRYSSIKEIIDDWNGKGNFIDFIDKIFDPQVNGFKLLKAGDKFHQQDLEAWVGGKCVLIKEDTFSKVEEELYR